METKPLSQHSVYYITAPHQLNMYRLLHIWYKHSKHETKSTTIQIQSTFTRKIGDY